MIGRWTEDAATTSARELRKIIGRIEAAPNPRREMVRGLALLYAALDELDAARDRSGLPGFDESEVVATD